MYICLCKGISESQVRQLGLAGICFPDALARALGLEEDGVCGRCLRNIEAPTALAASEAALRGHRHCSGSRTAPRCDCDCRSALSLAPSIDTRPVFHVSSTYLLF